MAKKDLDLSDLLGRPKGAEIISLDDMIPAPPKRREAVEVVLFWTDWTCACGRMYEMPTYGDTLTRYKMYKYGNFIGCIYEHYLPACHANLPRRVESRHIHLQHCPQCLTETQIHEDREAQNA